MRLNIKKQRQESQHKVYCYEAIPILFHNQPGYFLEMLERDGEKFLKFWWDNVGTQVEESYERPSQGLDYKVYTLADETRLAIIKLPNPQVKEAYFLGLWIPHKSRWFFWRNFPRVFSLERCKGDENGKPQTQLGELTKQARHFLIGKGSEPKMNAFYNLVVKELTKKKNFFAERPKKIS